MKKKIKLFDPYVSKEEEFGIIQVLRSNLWASGVGAGNVAKFENQFNKYVGSDCCVAVNSGTAALHLALSLFELKNKEVIIPSLSFVATAHAVTYNSGKPIFVDIDPATGCIDPEKVSDAITSKTKIILPVHFGGMPCDLNNLMKICKENNISLIEDAAHAAGTYYDKKKIGTHGNLVCFSFHPVKNLAMPTGGAIALNGVSHSKFETTLKSKRWCGITNRKGAKYNVDKIGWNYYMNEFSAAIGLEQLKKLDKMNNTRRQIARRYAEEIEIENKMPFSKDCSYHFYWIQVRNRDRFMQNMLDEGIETGIHYKPIHKMKFYNKHLTLPHTETIGNTIVSIPTHPNLDDEDVDKIIKQINKYS